MPARSAAVAVADWLRAARPAPLLAVLTLAQLAVVGWLAHRTPHNGWVWYSGGDATEYWSAQWAVGHALIPPAYLGWGLPILYAWIPLATGVSLLHGLPVVVLLHALVFVPLALVLAWALADRLYGRVYAWCTAALWVLAPLLAIWALAPRYQTRFEEHVLAPHWAGLTDMADFPSLVAVLAAAWATVRSVQNGRFGSALGAGVLGGLALGIKPSNGYFVLAVAVLLAVSKRTYVALGWAIGAAPALVTLLIWKARGLGDIPILSAYAPRREAAGQPVAVAVGRYVPFDWHHLAVEWGELREVFWDLRLLQFLIVAAALGALRRNFRNGLFLVTWFVGYCVLKGMSDQADISTTSYFRLTLPGLGALVFLLPCIAFLWPGTRAVRSDDRPQSWAVDLRSPFAVVGAVVAALPLVVVLAESPAPAAPARLARYSRDNTEAPIAASLRPHMRVRGGTVHLSWSGIATAGNPLVAYGILRTRHDDGCTYPAAGARECILTQPIGQWTENTSISERPGRGRFFYRIAMVADNRANPESSDVMLIGPAVSVRV
ncbi:MAG: hypothetical protein ACJ77E_10385 [Gaiellaceae bacterium]